MSLSLGIGLGLTDPNFAPFVPLSLFAGGEEGTWYDPSDLSTLWQDSARTTPVTSDSDPVGAIDDKSGNGNHALQATAAKRPTYKTSGGLSWLEFDGGDDFMATGSIDFTAGDKMSVFAGVHKASDAAAAGIAELGSGGGSGFFTLSAPGPTAGPKYRFASTGTNFVSAVSPDAFAAPITNVLTGLGDISGDTVTLRIDGTQEAQSTGDQGAGNYGNHVLYLGMRAGTSLPFTGKLYGLITRGAQSSAAEIAQAEFYMAGKSGVTL